MYSKKRIGCLIIACLLSSCSSKVDIDKLNKDIMMSYPYAAMADNSRNCSTVPYSVRINGIWTPVEMQLSYK